MSSYQGINDSYLPATPKPSLQQYDNYQIYNLYCVDTESEKTINGVVQPNLILEKQTSWLAVQAYNPIPILSDFDAIANLYQ